MSGVMKPDLAALIKKACADFDALPENEQIEIRRQQRESWVRGEMGWLKPKYKLVDGARREHPGHD